MKNILVLGAGLVAKPLVRYLLDQPDIHLKVASRTVSKADKLIDGHPKGESQQLNVEDQDALKKVIGEADVVIDELVALRHQALAKQADERIDFDLGSLPVLFAERVKCQRRDAEPSRRAHRCANRISPALVAQRPRLAPHLRPAAVAIHDDRHVLWQTADIDQPHGERVSCGSDLSKNGDEMLSGAI